MQALRKHCEFRWVLLYVERWLKASLQNKDGTLSERDSGTPQGGVISPILANLFLHYAFDAWVKREMSTIPFCRYADDGLLHCHSQEEAELVFKKITERFQQCGLEIHPDKSGIIYCKDRNRTGTYERVSFDFLGYTFRPRRCVDKKGVVHPNFLPAISNVSKKAMNREMRSWHIQLKNDQSLSELSSMFNAKIRGWHNYYGRFYRTAMSPTWQHLNWYLTQWVRRKYKRFARHKTRAREYLNRCAKANSNLFEHWKLGIYP